MKLKCLGIIALLGLAPSVAMAGEQANAASVTEETGLFSLLTGDTLPRGGWSFGLYYNNWDRVIDLEPAFSLNDNSQLSLDWNRLSASVGYGITDRWELSVMVPYENFNYDENDVLFRLDDGDGVGNVRVGTKLRLFGAQGDRSTLALNAFAELATGDDEVASSDTGFGVGLDWRVSNWVLNAGYFDRGSRGTTLSGRDIDNKAFTAGIGYAGAVTELRLDHRGPGRVRHRRQQPLRGQLRLHHRRPPVVRSRGELGVQLRPAHRPQPAQLDRRALPPGRPGRSDLLPAPGPSRGSASAAAAAASGRG